MTRWQLLAGPAVDGPQVDLTTARRRKASFTLTGHSTLSFTLDGRHEQTGYLHELATDVHLLRDGEPIYMGRVGQTGDSLDDTSHDVTVATADARALLARRLWHGQRTSAVEEQAQIAATLVDNVQAQPGGGLGIDTTAVTSTGVVARWAVDPGQPIAKLLDILAAGGTADQPTGAPGFDWDVTPGWSGRALRVWYPRRGEDRGVVLDYRHTGRPRPSLVATIDRKVDPGDYANVVYATGGSRRVRQATSTTDPDTGETTTGYTTITIPTDPVWGSADGVDTLPQGRWESALSYPDIGFQQQLADKAAERLAQLRRLHPSYRLTLRQGAWDGPGHVWLGDTIRLLIRSGRLAEDLTLRVTQLDLALGESGEEQVTLGVGPSQGTLLAALRDMETRLGTLERRRSGA